MNEWYYRSDGAVGDAVPDVDPQTMRELVADLFTPTGGLARKEFVRGSLGGRVACLDGHGDDGVTDTLVRTVPLSGALI